METKERPSSRHTSNTVEPPLRTGSFKVLRAAETEPLTSSIDVPFTDAALLGHEPSPPTERELPHVFQIVLFLNFLCYSPDLKTDFLQHAGSVGGESRRGIIIAAGDFAQGDLNFRFFCSG